MRGLECVLCVHKDAAECCQVCGREEEEEEGGGMEEGGGKEEREMLADRREEHVDMENKWVDF